MATIHKEIAIERSKEIVWDAIRDVGAIHKRLVPGFVVDCELEGEWRTITFANGMVVRELIVAVDEKNCRHAWSARARLSLIITHLYRYSGRRREVSCRLDSGFDAR